MKSILMRRQTPSGFSAGFTLIELLVVMAIIATLLSIVVPRYFNHAERARETALRQTLAVTRDAIDKFHADTNKYPASLEDLVAKRYVRKMPEDPITGRSDTWIIIAPPPKSDPGQVFDVKSGAEGKSADGTPYADW